MNSEKLIPVLRKFKNQSENEAFEKFFLIFNNDLVESRKTRDEKLLSEALEEEASKYQEIRQKLSAYVEDVYEIEKFIRKNDSTDVDEHFCSALAYAIYDSCECFTRNAFDYGVAYGKILAT